MCVVTSSFIRVAEDLCLVFSLSSIERLIVILYSHGPDDYGLLAKSVPTRTAMEVREDEIILRFCFVKYVKFTLNKWYISLGNLCSVPLSKQIDNYQILY